jgi:hypothetical protein
VDVLMRAAGRKMSGEFNIFSKTKFPRTSKSFNQFLNKSIPTNVTEKVIKKKPFKNPFRNSIKDS